VRGDRVKTQPLPQLAKAKQKQPWISPLCGEEQGWLGRDQSKAVPDETFNFFADTSPSAWGPRPTAAKPKNPRTGWYRCEGNWLNFRNDHWKPRYPLHRGEVRAVKIN
jgi:hypothetical protein